MSKPNPKIRSAAALVVALCAALAAPLLPAQSGRALQSIDFVALDADRVLLTLTLSEAAPEPVVFTIDKPARLSLDLPDTRVAVAERFKKINVGVARSVATAEAKGRTRVVVELAQVTPYNVRVDGNKVFLQLDSPGTAVGSASVSTASTMRPFSATGSALRNIDFRRGEKGEGRVVVQLADPRTSVDIREEGGKVVATFKNTTVADNLVRRLDVLDFATPVKFIDTSRDGINTSITVTPVANQDFEQVAYQAGDTFTLELQPLTAEKVEERRRAQPQWTGERISLSFQAVDIRSLLQIIADVAGTNMVVSDSVQGEIAMRLQNVPWDQALDIILRTKGLGMRQQGNVMLVAPLDELAAREKAELETEKAKAELAPLRSEIVQVNYAKAADLRDLIKTGENSILSERGRISVDERTNTLIILETREKLAEIRELVGRLDIPVRQVLIESRIVIANDDFAKEIGTRFGVTTVSDNNGDGLLTTSGSITATDTTASSFVNNGGFPVTIGAAADRLNVNLASTIANAGRIAFAVLGADYLLDLELSALQTEGRGEVVSAPRVVTQNGQKATIKQGFEVPFTTVAGLGVATVTFKEALLKLEVTPSINPNDSVVMELVVNKDEPDFSRAVLGNPPLNKREIVTTVQVRTGETVVLGGAYESTATVGTNKVPLLGDVPLLGQLFRRDSNVMTKREMLIFVTPKVLQEGLRVN